MIFRLSQKLNSKIKAGMLPTLPLDDPLTDWSAASFVVGRTQYILLDHMKSLYSTVLPGRRITTIAAFVERASRYGPPPPHHEVRADPALPLRSHCVRIWYDQDQHEWVIVLRGRRGSGSRLAWSR